MRLRLFALVVAGTTAVVSSPVQAQTRLDVTTHLGMYFPLAPVVRETVPQLTMRQLTAAVFGGSLSAHFSKRFALEASVDYSPSAVAVTQNSRTTDITGNMLLASGRAVVKFGPYKPKTPELQFGMGGGFVKRFGTAWRSKSGTTDPAGVLSIAGRYPLGQTMPINVRVEIENYISRVQFNSSDGSTTNKRFNHDTLWSFGVELPLSGPDNQ